MKSAHEILSAEKCGDIFSRNDKVQIALEYREMIRHYHPDICKLPNANDITSKLNTMYSIAVELAEKGLWEVSNLLEIRDTSGKKYSTRYRKVFQFEMGTAYVSDRSLTYIYESNYEPFFKNAVKQIQGIKYVSPEIKAEFSRYMPKIKFAFATDDHRFCLILNKEPDVFRLYDILEYFNGDIPERHVAWIISRLCNLCCFFEYAGFSHNALTTGSCFLSPKDHTVLILGGWGYAMQLGKPLLGVPRAVYNIMPVKTKSDKCSDIVTDLESVKEIGRQLFKLNDIPSDIKSFLSEGSSSNPRDEFTKWSNALDKSYGKRKFIEMSIGRSDIYKN